MGILWLALACAGPKADSADATGPAGTTPAAAPEVQAEAPALVIPDVPVGATIEGRIGLTNLGASDVTVVNVVGPDRGDLLLDVSPTRFIAPGARTELVATWSPTVVQNLVGDVVVTLDGAGGTTDLVVPIEGVATGASLTLSAVEHDFGAVGVGCEEEVSLTLSNAGNADLVIDGITLEGPSTFELTLDDEAALPWTLGPFGSTSVKVKYAPDDLPLQSALLEVQSTDGTHSTVLSGSGVADAARSATFDASSRGYATSLVHVNECALDGFYGTYHVQFEEGLPSFFQTLRDNQAQFRIAFLWNSNGVVDHDEVQFIDHTFSVDEAVETAIAMVQPGANAGDNDRTFTTLLAGVQQNEDWLFEDQWADGKLTFIAINRDTEQSGGSTAAYIADAQALKSDPEKVVFSAIAGPLPTGCGSAEPFQGYVDAVNATGGVFLSICEPTWDDIFSQLAATVADGAGFFPLTGTPLVSSIAVTVDGVTQSIGWDYDPTVNAIVFQDDYYPPDGSTVAVSWFESSGCG